MSGAGEAVPGAGEVAPGASGDALLADVSRRLRGLVASAAGVPAELIEDGSSFDGDLAMDSMAFVTLQVEIEREFDIDCSLDDLSAVEPSFGEVARLVAHRVKGEGG